LNLRDLLDCRAKQLTLLYGLYQGLSAAFLESIRRVALDGGRARRRWDALGARRSDDCCLDLAIETARSWLWMPTTCSRGFSHTSSKPVSGSLSLADNRQLDA